MTLREKLEAEAKAWEKSAEEAERFVGARYYEGSADTWREAVGALRALLARHPEPEVLGAAPGNVILRYVSWEVADELHRLAQPLTDHPIAGKLACRVCDWLTAGSAVASRHPEPAPVADPPEMRAELTGAAETFLDAMGGLVPPALSPEVEEAIWHLMRTAQRDWSEDSWEPTSADVEAARLALRAAIARAIEEARR
jgi:hypothetical protein